MRRTINAEIQTDFHWRRPRAKDRGHHIVRVDCPSGRPLCGQSGWFDGWGAPLAMKGVPVPYYSCNKRAPTDGRASLFWPVEAWPSQSTEILLVIYEQTGGNKWRGWRKNKPEHRNKYNSSELQLTTTTRTAAAAATAPDTTTWPKVDQIVSG